MFCIKGGHAGRDINMRKWGVSSELFEKLGAVEQQLLERALAESPKD